MITSNFPKNVDNTSFVYEWSYDDLFHYTQYNRNPERPNSLIPDYLCEWEKRGKGVVCTRRLARHTVSEAYNTIFFLLMTQKNLKWYAHIRLESMSHDSITVSH